MIDCTFYRNKKILITGHTGFKGSWVTQLLLEMGAEVTGYALEAPTQPSMFQICRLDKEIDSVKGDVRDLDKLQNVIRKKRPELILHMAAQPIVREGYRNPVYTYEVNVMGTVHILECARINECVRSLLNVTTDKVYLNREWLWGYRENEELNGFDPYSNSKSCSELVTDSYRNSFFSKKGGREIPISTVRAGNVIGGGDFAADRILPDCVRAAQKDKPIEIRNPYSIRPYQHVLESVTVYLALLQEQVKKPELAGSYNVGPDEGDCLDTRTIASVFCKEWTRYTGRDVEWICKQQDGPHEARYLKLDCSKLKNAIEWKPNWKAEYALNKTVEWYVEYLRGQNMREYTEKQIREFMKAYE